MRGGGGWGVVRGGEGRGLGSREEGRSWGSGERTGVVPVCVCRYVVGYCVL